MLTPNKHLSQFVPVRCIVLADGCFDPLHVGHLRYLEVASRLGDFLVVHVAPDEVILAKGREPFQSRTEREATVRGLGCVKDIALARTLEGAIHDLCPRFLVKGSDWVGHLPETVIKACRDNGTEILYTDTQQRTSTERLAK